MLINAALKPNAHGVLILLVGSGRFGLFIRSRSKSKIMFKTFSPISVRHRDKIMHSIFGINPVNFPNNNSVMGAIR